MLPTWKNGPLNGSQSTSLLVEGRSLRNRSACTVTELPISGQQNLKSTIHYHGSTIGFPSYEAGCLGQPTTQVNSISATHKEVCKCFATYAARALHRQAQTGDDLGGYFRSWSRL
eukprot:3992675-Amphidinium_carterae.1